MPIEIVHIESRGCFPRRSMCGRVKPLAFMFVAHAQASEEIGWRVCKQCKKRAKNRYQGTAKK